MRPSVLLAAAAVVVVGIVALVSLFASREETDTAPNPAAVEPDAFHALRGRPVRAPERVRAGFCPGPDPGAVELPLGIPAKAGLGSGPVYPVSRAIPRALDFFAPDEDDALAQSSWRANETMWVSERSYRGPVLVRGKALLGGGHVGFGPGLHPERELRLSAGPWDEARPPVRLWDTVVRVPKGWRVTSALTRVSGRPAAGRHPECYFFQVDGNRFSQTIVFGAIIQP